LLTLKQKQNHGIEKAPKKERKKERKNKDGIQDCAKGIS